MTQKEILKRVTYWQEKLGLINWEVSVAFEPVNYPKETDKFAGIAKTHVNTTYKIATVFFEPKFLKLVNDNIVVHELLHCLLGEFSGYTNTLHHKNQRDLDRMEHYEEQLVSEIERIILRMYRLRNKIIDPLTK